MRSLFEQKEKRCCPCLVTRLHTRLGDSSDHPDTIDQEWRLTTWLQTLAEEFKVHHYAVINLIEDEGDFAKELWITLTMISPSLSLVWRSLHPESPLQAPVCPKLLLSVRNTCKGDCLPCPIVSALLLLKRTMFVSFNSMRNISLIWNGNLLLFDMNCYLLNTRICQRNWWIIGHYRTGHLDCSLWVQKLLAHRVLALPHLLLMPSQSNSPDGKCRHSTETYSIGRPSGSNSVSLYTPGRV